MCRLFPVELIESIMTGCPTMPGAVDVVAKHISCDWREAGVAPDLSHVVHILARVAVLGAVVAHTKASPPD